MLTGFIPNLYPGKCHYIKMFDSNVWRSTERIRCYHSSSDEDSRLLEYEAVQLVLRKTYTRHNLKNFSLYGFASREADSQCDKLGHTKLPSSGNSSGVSSLEKRSVKSSGQQNFTHDANCVSYIWSLGVQPSGSVANAAEKNVPTLRWESNRLKNTCVETKCDVLKIGNFSRA